MKKLIKTLLAFAATSLLAFSCSNEITDSKALLLGLAGGNSTAKIETGSRAVATLNRSVTVTIYLFGVPATCTKPGVWAWAENGNDDIGYTAGNWPGDATDLMTADNSTGYSGYK